MWFDWHQWQDRRHTEERREPQKAAGEKRLVMARKDAVERAYNSAEADKTGSSSPLSISV
jgi:hypothetical protein